MLVLSRKVGESIVVPGCRLVLTVLELERGRVRLGVSAPSDVPVHRQEVWERIHPAPSGPADMVLPPRGVGPLVAGEGPGQLS
jgi:carbon storage regulator